MSDPGNAWPLSFPWRTRCVLYLKALPHVGSRHIYLRTLLRIEKIQNKIQHNIIWQGQKLLSDSIR